MIVAFVILFGLLTSLLIYGIRIKIQSHNNTVAKIAKLPPFLFTTLSSQNFSSSSIKNGPVLILYFHPDCEHCQYEISEILNSKIPDMYAKVVLVSGAHPDSVKKFFRHVDYSRFPAIVLLIDNSHSFESIFGNGIVPSSYIYDKNLTLVKEIHGEVKSEAILRYIKVGEQDQ